MIASHNSATGEKGSGLLSLLVTPFARTQRKTILEQYASGVRLFDIRLKLIGGKWSFAHGLWHSDAYVYYTLKTLNDLSEDEPCYITLTYEGGTQNAELFKSFATTLKDRLKNLRFGAVCCKYGDGSKFLRPLYQVMIQAEKGWIDKPVRSAFVNLNGRTWHTLIPVPWLWDRIKGEHKDNDNEYIYYDFV